MKNAQVAAHSMKPNLLNVWFVSFFFPPDFGGSSTRSWNFAKSLQLRGYKIGVVSSFPQYPYGRVLQKRYQRKLVVFEEIEGIKVARFRIPPLPHQGILNRLILFTYFSIVSVILRPYFKRFLGKPNLIYSHTPVIFSAFVGRVYAKIEKTPLVVDCHDLWPDVLSILETRALPLFMLLGRVLALMSYQSCDIVTIWGIKARDVISKLYNIPKESVYSVYTGVDTVVYRPIERKVALASMGQHLPNKDYREKFVILYSGAVNRYYDFDFLIRLSEIFRDIKSVLFLITGEGEEKENLIKICRERGLSNVCFCSYLHDRELIPLRINLADLCIIPLRENNNPSAIFDPYVLELPTKLFEYTSCGRPVLCVGEGETSDIIAKWNAGVSVNSDEENAATIIRELSINKARLKVMGDGARRLAEEVFSLESVGERIDEILRELCVAHSSKNLQRKRVSAN